MTFKVIQGHWKWHESSPSGRLPSSLARPTGSLVTGNDVNYYYYNIKNNNYDNVYGAVIMTKINERVHPVHSMNTD